MCTASNSSQKITIHHFSSSNITTLPCNQHQSRQLSRWRKLESLRMTKSNIDLSSLEVSTLPNIKPFNLSVTIPFDTAESRNSTTRWSGTKKIAVTSFSVQNNAAKVCIEGNYLFFVFYTRLMLLNVILILHSMYSIVIKTNLQGSRGFSLR